MNFSQLAFGSFVLKVYSLFVLVAFLVWAWGWYKNLEKQNFDTNFFAHHFSRWVLGGVLIGRLTAMVTVSGIIERQGLLGFFMFWDGGINILMTIVGGVGMYIWDTQKNLINTRRWADETALPFIKALLITDIGAYLTGAIYGSETSLPLAVTYNTFGVDIVSPVHPVGLYAFLLHFLLYRFLVRHAEGYKKKFGQLASITAVGWAFIASLLFFVRGDTGAELFGLRITHIVFLLLFIGLFALHYTTYIQTEKPTKEA